MCVTSLPLPLQPCRAGAGAVVCAMALAAIPLCLPLLTAFDPMPAAQVTCRSTGGRIIHRQYSYAAAALRRYTCTCLSRSSPLPFPPRLDTPSSLQVIGLQHGVSALFDRYDFEGTGTIVTEQFVTMLLRCVPDCNGALELRNSFATIRRACRAAGGLHGLRRLVQSLERRSRSGLLRRGDLADALLELGAYVKDGDVRPVLVAYDASGAGAISLPELVFGLRGCLPRPRRLLAERTWQTLLRRAGMPVTSGSIDIDTLAAAVDTSCALFTTPVSPSCCGSSRSSSRLTSAGCKGICWLECSHAFSCLQCAMSARPCMTVGAAADSGRLAESQRGAAAVTCCSMSCLLHRFLWCCSHFGAWDWDCAAPLLHSWLPLLLRGIVPHLCSTTIVPSVPLPHLYRSLCPICPSATAARTARNVFPLRYRAPGCQRPQRHHERPARHCSAVDCRL